MRCEAPAFFHKIGFIGCGKLGFALLEGLVRSKKYKCEDIVVRDRSPSDALKQCGVTLMSDYSEFMKTAETILVCVKPKDLPSVLNNIMNQHYRNQTVVSVCAGVSLDTITQLSKKNGQINAVRVMPNVLSATGNGLTSIAENDFLKEHVEKVISIFECVGPVQVIPEYNMNAMTAMCASGPAFLSLFLEALADAGVKVGLNKKVASSVALQMVLSTSKHLHETSTEPSVLRDEISSPAGTTIAGVFSLEKTGFRYSVMEAVNCAEQRASEIEELQRRAPMIYNDNVDPCKEE